MARGLRRKSQRRLPGLRRADIPILSSHWAWLRTEMSTGKSAARMGSNIRKQSAHLATAPALAGMAILEVRAVPVLAKNERIARMLHSTSRAAYFE